MPPRLRQRRLLSYAEEEEGGQANTASPGSEKSGQKRRLQTGPETVGGGGGPGGEGGGSEAGAGRPEDEILFKMDPAQVLDCIVCYNPLAPPIYQCEVGHVLCSVCRGTIINSCPICFRVVGYCRCYALEHMVDAVKVRCSNAIYGCDEWIRYYQKEKHEKACTHAPCLCPEDGCLFEGSTGRLLDHFVTKHKWSPTKFRYGEAHRISIPQNRRFTLLVGNDQSMFLMVNSLLDTGNALSMVCIRPHESGSCYSSKISAIHRAEAGKGYAFHMIPHVASSSLHSGVQLGDAFLLVYPGLVDKSTNELTINILVEKI
ncbi:hypothetical protein BS78_03G082500 [Paspalum vaginatum]|nr:hypothetical protein BS78_03G082500 [Paspalum vaginatum]